MKKAMFITGGATGTGYATAEKFASNGYAVFLTSRNVDNVTAEQSAKKLSEKYGVFSKGYVLDIRNEQAVIDIFKDIDSCDCFVETIPSCHITISLLVLMVCVPVE